MSSASAEPRRRALAACLAAAALLAGPLAPAPAPAAGPVVIEGNRALPASRLRQAAAEELAHLGRSDGGRADADDAAYRMTLAYRGAGFAFAEVDYRLGDDGVGGRVVFTVREGPRVLLGSVTITGAAAIDEDRLRALLPGAGGLLPGTGAHPPFVEEEVRAGVRGIAELYRSEGFLDARVEGPRIVFAADRSRADVAVTVSEGPRYRVREVTFEGAPPAATAVRLAGLRGQLVGAVFTALTPSLIEDRVLEACGEAGYPDARATVTRRAGEGPGDVLIGVAVEPGPQVSVSRVVVTGNRRTRHSFIAGLLPLAAGQRYRLSAVRAAVRQLYDTGLFTRVSVRLDPDATGPERPLLVEVEEAPAIELSLRLLWSSYELLRGEAGARHRNLFGTGRAVGLEGGLSVKRASVTADLTDPHFLGTPVVATLPLSFSRDVEPSFTRTQVELAPQLAHQLTGSLSATVSYPVQFARAEAASAAAPAELATENYRLARLGLQVRSDTRRGLFFPTGGHEVTLAGEVADPAVWSQLNFVRLIGTARGYRALGEATVLAARAESGIAVPTHGEGDLPFGERFFLGGERSVRSFGEAQLGPRDAAGQPVGGLGYTLLSLELRRRLRGNLSGALFADTGTVSPNRSFPELVAAAEEGTLGDGDVFAATRRDFLRDFRWAVGFGVRYLLPVGPARLDLAWNPDRREGEDAYRVNLSVGMAF